MMYDKISKISYQLDEGRAHYTWACALDYKLNYWCEDGLTVNEQPMAIKKESLQAIN